MGVPQAENRSLAGDRGIGVPGSHRSEPLLETRAAGEMLRFPVQARLPEVLEENHES